MTTTPKARVAAAKKKRAPAKPPAPYHHGDLPQAILVAAEAVLKRDGIAGLGLRAIAREAGVSHTAPKHHFGDTAGILGELAAVGFRRLGDTMLEARAGGTDARARRLAIGYAYVRFAAENPALFGLMFRNEKLDMKNASLAAAMRATMRVMASTLGEEVAPAEGKEQLALTHTDGVRITAAWAYVHGLATLLIDQRLGGITRAAAFESPTALVDAALAAAKLVIEPTAR
jgi:AcrR family transcriptional regulator